MAQESIIRSDLSGEIVPKEKSVRVRLMYGEKGRVDERCDLSVEEAEKLLPFTRAVEPRPRRVPVENPRRRSTA